MDGLGYNHLEEDVTYHDYHRPEFGNRSNNFAVSTLNKIEDHSLGCYDPGMKSGRITLIGV
jgi:hypothetical protein